MGLTLNPNLTLTLILALILILTLTLALTPTLIPTPALTLNRWVPSPVYSLLGKTALKQTTTWVNEEVRGQ